MTAEAEVPVRVEQVSADGSGVATLIGWRVDTGERVACYADARMAGDLAEAVAAADELEDLPVASVPSWAIAGH